MDNYKTIESKLSNRESFNGNSLNGFWDSINRIYVVYSYSTLIASYNPATGLRWVNPNKFSQTTSKQQNLIKRAWGLVN